MVDNVDEIGNVAAIYFGSGTGGYIPGSGTNDVMNLTLTSNVNILGMWIFQVDGANIQSKSTNIVVTMTVQLQQMANTY